MKFNKYFQQQSKDRTALCLSSEFNQNGQAWNADRRKENDAAVAWFEALITTKHFHDSWWGTIYIS